jgi:hypothetical protein
MAAPVNPRDHLPLLVVWSTFCLFAAFSNLLLALASLLGYVRANRMLINLEAVFVWTTFTGSSLICIHFNLS